MSKEWINALTDIEQDANLPITRKASFSAFHAAMYRTSRPCRDISVLMRLLNDSIISPAMVAHSFKVFPKKLRSSTLSNHLSSRLIKQFILLQTSAMVAIWRVQRCRGKDGSITHWDGFLKCNRWFVRGSGWVIITEKAGMTTVGWHDSFLSGSKIKRSGYAHQVPLAALIKLARQAFEAQNKYLDYIDWKRHRCSHSTTTSYWFTVIDPEVLRFMFIRSLREGSFPLFVTSLENIVPWMFSLDHMRWRFWVYWVICCSLVQYYWSMHFCEWVLQVAVYKEVPPSWKHSALKSSTGTTYQASHAAKQVRVEESSMKSH